MKFIFPKNYKYNSKLFGMIDYVTAIVVSIIGIILYLMTGIFTKNIFTRIYIFLILFFPIILLVILLCRSENIVMYIIKIGSFLKRRGIYLYNKYLPKELKDKNTSA